MLIVILELGALNFNRFALRGPEPTPDGDKKRTLILGESDYFGAKLPDERDLWSIRLQKILSSKGHADWEVLNERNPGYNTVQRRALWEKELNHIQPDILVLRIGINEVFQAYVMGSKWKPGLPWHFYLSFNILCSPI